MNIWFVLAFVVALLASVMIHEAGHFLTARAFGMKATQFFVGFGPTLFSRRRGETEYGVKAIPAGGFVKIIGMTPLEEVDPADRKRAFFRQPTPQRVVVLAAGSAMHFVIAVVLAIGVSILVPIANPGSGIARVSNCVPVSSAGNAKSLTDPTGACTGNFVDSPARLAGLRAGDVVTAVDGHPVVNDSDAAPLIRKASSPQVTVTVRRGKQTLQLPVTLAAVERDTATGGPGTDRAFAIGVSFGGVTGYHQPTASQSLHETGQYLSFNDQSVLFGTFYALGNIGSEAGQLFNHDRAQDAANGGAQLSSVVGIAKVSGQIGDQPGVPISVELGELLVVIAAVNASVGILNLLPLLPFDGGHIAVTLAERWTRRRRRVVVAPAGTLVSTDDPEVVGRRIGSFYTRGAPIMYAFSLVIIVFSFVVLVADIKNPAT